MQFLEASDDKESVRELKTKIVSEAGTATSNVQDALIFLTSIFKIMAIALLEVEP